MYSTIKISPAERELLLNFHRKNLDSLTEKLDAIQREIEESRYRIEELVATGQHHLSFGSIIGDYAQDWTLWKKAEYALQNMGRLSTTREISIFLVDKEAPLFIDDEDTIRLFIRNLGATLKQKIDKEETFYRLHDTDKSEIYYGLTEWWMEGTRVAHPKYNRED